MGMDPEEFGTLTRFADRIDRLPSDVSATMRSGHITWGFALDVVKAEPRVTVEWLVQGRGGNIASGVLRELLDFMPKAPPSA